MNAFIEFLREYWFQFATGLIAIIEIILLVVKRKPKSIDDFKLAFSDALSRVPAFVALVERPGEGSSKKKEVIDWVIDYVCSALGRKLTSNEIELITEEADSKIEMVLSTPTKKEKINEK